MSKEQTYHELYNLNTLIWSLSMPFRHFLSCSARQQLLSDALAYFLTFHEWNANRRSKPQPHLIVSLEGSQSKVQHPHGNGGCVHCLSMECLTAWARVNNAKDSASLGLLHLRPQRHTTVFGDMVGVWIFFSQELLIRSSRPPSWWHTIQNHFVLYKSWICYPCVYFSFASSEIQLSKALLFPKAQMNSSIYFQQPQSA